MWRITTALTVLTLVNNVSPKQQGPELRLSEVATLKNHDTYVRHVVYVGNASRAVSVDPAGTVSVWSLDDLRLVQTLNPVQGIAYAALVPNDSAMLVLPKAKRSMTYLRLDGERRRLEVNCERMKKREYLVLNLFCRVSESSKYALVGSGDVNPPVFFLVSLKHHDCVRTFSTRLRMDYRRAIRGDISPDDQFVAGAFELTQELKDSSPSPGALYLWSLSSGKRVHIYEEQKTTILDLRFTKDNRSIVSADEEGHVRQWAVQPAKLLRTFARPDPALPVVEISLLEDKELLFGISQRCIYIWSMKTGVLLQETLAPDSANFVTMCVIPARKLLLTGCTDHTVRVWEIKGLDSEVNQGRKRGHQCAGLSR